MFKELELDCDEQIKQLDEIERKRNENHKIQMSIVQQIKADYSRLVFYPTENLKKRPNKNKDKSMKERNQLRFHFNATANSIPKRKIFEKEFFICSTLVHHSFELYSIKRLGKGRSEYINVYSKLKEKKSTENVHQLLTSADLKAMLAVDESRVQTLFFLVENSSRQPFNVFMRLNSQTRKAKRKKAYQRTKNESSVPPACSNSNKSKSLLDKYFERYCSADKEPTSGEKVPRNEDDEENAKSIIAKKSVGTSQKPNDYLTPNSAFKQIESDLKVSNHFGEAFSSVTSLGSTFFFVLSCLFLYLCSHSDLELLNMIEVSKWLIQAGYAQHVHSFLSIEKLFFEH